MNNGWIKTHRKITEWEWYQDSNVFRVFFHLLLTANHEAKKWRGIEVKRGQKITSYQHLAEELGLSLQSVRTAIKKLKLTGELTHTGNNKYSVFTIVNWETYQIDNKQPNNPVTNKQHSNNIQLTTNKNDKKEKNVRMKRTTIAGKPATEHNPLGAQIIEAMILVDRKNKRYYGIPVQRSACDFLIEEYGLEEVKKRIGFLNRTNKMPFFPTITTPVQLVDNWTKLENQMHRHKAELESKTKREIL